MNHRYGTNSLKRFSRFTRVLFLIFAMFAVDLPVLANDHANRTAEQKTALFLESIRDQPGLLYAFLKQMPKGGDLHSHLSGAVYAESMICWAA